MGFSIESTGCMDLELLEFLMEMPTACVRKCVEDRFCGISRSNKVMAIAPIMPSSFPYREGGR